MDSLRQFRDIGSRYLSKANETRKGLPSFLVAQVESLTVRLSKARTVQQAFNVGDQLPADVDLVTPAGDKINLLELSRTKPVILVFFRGGWCPFCSLELDFFVEATDMLKGLGAELIAVSPLPDSATTELITSKNIKFTVIGGPTGVKLIQRFGLHYTALEDLVGGLKGIGLDLTELYQTQEVLLPIAASYVINTQGEVAYGFVEEDFSYRGGVDELAAAVVRTQRARE